MTLKKYITIAIISLIVNAASVFNVGYGFWSIVLLFVAVFEIGMRDSNKMTKDKKVYGFIYTFMLSVFLFMSLVMGFAGFVPMRYVVYTYLPDFRWLLLIGSVAGVILYYYLHIRLLLEAIHILKQKTDVQEEEAAAPREMEAKHESTRDTRVKGKYIIILCVLNLLVNISSLYNLFYVIGSLFLLLLGGVPILFVKIVNRARKVEKRNRNFAVRNVADYGSLKATRVSNKIAIIVGLIVIYGMTVVFTITQLNERANIGDFIADHFQSGVIPQLAPILSVTGYVLYGVTLLLVTWQSIYFIRKEAIFGGK